MFNINLIHILFKFWGNIFAAVTTMISTIVIVPNLHEPGKNDALWGSDNMEQFGPCTFKYTSPAWLTCQTLNIFDWLFVQIAAVAARPAPCSWIVDELNPFTWLADPISRLHCKLQWKFLVIITLRMPRGLLLQFFLWSKYQFQVAIFNFLF